MKKVLKVLHIMLDIVLAAALVLSVSLILLTTFTPIKTLFIYKVVSGSMEPAIHVGSVVISKVTDQSNINNGDIISYSELNNADTIVTHRVIGIKSIDSSKIFTTKGDANNVPDPDTITFDRVTGKVIVTIPFLGYLLVWVKQPLGFVVTIIFPALFIIISEIFAMKRTIEENAIKKFKKKQSEPVTKIITLLLSLGLFSSFILLDSGKTLSFFSSGKILKGNIFSTDCWAPPSVPELIYPKDNSIILRGSEWDLNPYMDWNDSTSECSLEDLKITYMYESYTSYTNGDLTNLAYASQPLEDSMIPAPGSPNDTYWWRAKACDSFGRCSEFSSPFVFTYDTSISEGIETSGGPDFGSAGLQIESMILVSSSDPSENGTDNSMILSPTIPDIVTPDTNDE
jgi:signal peptidase